MEQKEQQERGILFKVPFVGRASMDFRKDISKLFLDKYKVVTTGVFTSCKVGDFFGLKSDVPKPLLADDVYKFKCLSDTSISYIGKTKRHLSVRVQENPSPVKGSAIYGHIVSCPGCQSQATNLIDHFDILRKSSGFDLDINEALLIRKSQPSLNKQMYQNGSILLRIYN